MGPYGSVGANIKTGKRNMAQDHSKTPPDPKKAYYSVFLVACDTDKFPTSKIDGK